MRRVQLSERRDAEGRVVVPKSGVGANFPTNTSEELCPRHPAFSLLVVNCSCYVAHVTLVINNVQFTGNKVRDPNYITISYMVISIQCIALLPCNSLIIILDRSPHFLRIKRKDECYDRHNDNDARENEGKNASNFGKCEAMAS